MQLFIRGLRCLTKAQTSQINFYQQINGIHLLTPISSTPNFLQLKDNTQTTGLRNSLTFSPYLYKSFHTRNKLCLKYTSNILNNKKIDDDKKEVYKNVIENNNKEITSSLEELSTSKLGLFAKFKKMGKDYWYVLIPVHLVTSSVWLGAFYYTSTSGVDIVGILESYKFSETIINPLRNSSLGHIAVAYFLYKIATPARYFVTVAGTTMAIKQGIKHGLIKPMPSKDQMVQIYKDKKDEMHKIYQDKKDEMHQKMSDRKQAIRDKYMKK